MYFLLLRIIGIGNQGALAALVGSALVVATVGLLLFALHAIYTSIRKMDRPVITDEENIDAELETCVDGLDQPRRGSSSPQENTELELTVIDTTVDAQRGSAASRMTSPWQLLGLCAAESYLGEPENAICGDSAVAELRAKLVAQQKLMRDKDKAHTQAMNEKDAEIARLVALHQG